MANVIKPKKSNTALSVPTTSSLADGEMAVNTVDKKLYVRDGANIVEVANANTGTVTSVGLALPSIFNISNSPVTSSGTLTATLAAQASNLVWAGPASGESAAPTWRTLISEDMPGHLPTWGGIDPTAKLDSDGYFLETGINGYRGFRGASAAQYSIVWTTTGTQAILNASSLVRLAIGNVGILDVRPWAIEAYSAVHIRGTVNSLHIVERTDASANALTEYRGTGGSVVVGLAGGAFRIGAPPSLGSLANAWYSAESTRLVSGTDNTRSLGASAVRWSVLYAATGSINTSDAREKTPPRDMSPVEIECALAIARLPSVFQWLASIAEKGEEAARLHVSPTVQDVIATFESFGLDPFRYSFVCYDEWPETPEVIESWEAEPEQVEEWPDLFDADGNLIKPAGRRVIREAREAGSEIVQQFQAAGDRYSLRPSELEAFCRRALVYDRDLLETRLRALETKLETAGTGLQVVSAFNQTVGN